MKASELRIGNLAYVSKSEYLTEILGIEPLRLFSHGKWLDINEYKPIPLTEEWCIKLGFTEFVEGQYVSSNTDIVIEFNPFKVFIICPMPWIEVNLIKHVHQLQNLHFALTGEELKLEA